MDHVNWSVLVYIVDRTRCVNEIHLKRQVPLTFLSNQETFERSRDFECRLLWARLREPLDVDLSQILISTDYFGLDVAAINTHDTH